VIFLLLNDLYIVFKFIYQWVNGCNTYIVYHIILSSNIISTSLDAAAAAATASSIYLRVFQLLSLHKKKFRKNFPQ
jgi:hypothetical protein